VGRESGEEKVVLVGFVSGKTAKLTGDEQHQYNRNGQHFCLTHLSSNKVWKISENKIKF
jgi:hypothetical protein